MDDQAAKRFRPDEILDSQHDPSKIITRLLVGRQQFSKIIGKGGELFIASSWSFILLSGCGSFNIHIFPGPQER
jgi:hypothetical protein